MLKIYEKKIIRNIILTMLRYIVIKRQPQTEAEDEKDD